MEESAWNEFRRKLAERALVVREVAPFEVHQLEGEPGVILALYESHGFGPLCGWARAVEGRVVELHEMAVVPVKHILLAACAAHQETRQPVEIPAGVRARPAEVYDLEIVCKLHYVPRLAGAGHETPHGINFYVSESFSATPQTVFVHHRDMSLPRAHTLRFKVTRSHVPVYALLNIDSYARFLNTENEMCVNQSGYNNLALADLPAQIGRALKLSLVVPNSETRESKGTLYVTPLSLSLPVAAHARSARELVDAETKRFDALTRAYVRANNSFYDAHPASARSISNVTVYSYHGRRGCAPGSTFDLFRLPPSRERYYVNALHYALRRRAPAGEGDLWAQTDARGRVLAVMDMLCIYVNYCKYITDIVDNNLEGSPRMNAMVELIESFDDVRLRDAADCEDFTRETLCEAMELKYNRSDLASPVMQEVRAIADDYVFASVLCGVSEDSLSHNGGGPRGDDSLNGHECVVAVPKYVFFEALRRADPSHEVLRAWPVAERSRGRGEHIYILEGTGDLYPEPRAKSERYSSIEPLFDGLTGPSKRVCRQFFYDPRTGHNFYKVMITLLTPEPFLKYGGRFFEFLVCKNGKRGVPLGELVGIDAHAEVSIMPAPELSVALFRAASRLNGDSTPLVPLRPAVELPGSSSVVAQLTLARELGRPLASVDPADVFQFQVRHEICTPEMISDILSIVTRYRLNVACFPEPVKLTEGEAGVCGGYNVVVW